VDTHSQTSHFVVLLVTENAATCQAFALGMAGETSCPADLEAIASLLARRPVDLVVVAGDEGLARELRARLGAAQALVCPGPEQSCSAQMLAAVEQGDPALALRALVQALCQVNGGAPAAQGGEAAPAPLPAAEASAPAEPGPEQVGAPAAPTPPQGEQDPSHSPDLLALENKLERVLNRRLQ